MDASGLEILRRLDQLPVPAEAPLDPIPPMHMTHQRARMDHFRVTHTHHFFLPRAAHAPAAMWRRANACRDPRIRRRLLRFVEQAVRGMSIPARYVPTHYSRVNRYLTGGYHVPSQHAERSPWYVSEGKRKRLAKAFQELQVPNNSGPDDAQGSARDPGSMETRAQAAQKPIIPRHPRESGEQAGMTEFMGMTGCMGTAGLAGMTGCAGMTSLAGTTG